MTREDVNRPIDELSDKYVEAYARLDPIAATFDGIAGHDHELTDFSPAAAAERADHDRLTLARVGHDHRRVRRRSRRRRCDPRAVGGRGRNSTTAASTCGRSRSWVPPVQEVREAFDMLQTETEADWSTVVARMARVPECLSSLEAAFTEGRQRGLWSRRSGKWPARSPRSRCGPASTRRRPGRTSTGSPTSWPRRESDPTGCTPTAKPRRPVPRPPLASFARYLTAEYAPDATERDAVGEERYAIGARIFNGTELDLHETYAWGWEELHRIEHARRPSGGADLAERHRRRGDRAARNRSGPSDRGRSQPARLAPGSDGPHHRRDERRALRHPRAGADGRGDDRAAGWRVGDVLHGAVRRLLPARPHVVPDDGQHAVPAVGRSVDLLPRGRSRPSPASRAGAVPRRRAHAVPAAARVVVGSR